MFFDALFRSLEPLHNPVGFGVADFVELAVAAMLAWLVWWRARWAWLSSRPAVGVCFFAVMPVAMRLLLLRGFPVPVPDIYDEFGHLLVADTLRHGRLANPPHALHQFFETFFVLQQPTYSSIYPIGNGLAMAAGWVIFGLPWAGVLMCVAAFCGLSYWMLRGWTTPGWALAGGALAVMEFGPLNQWTNSYWGGALAATAGCFVYGALPRLARAERTRDGALLGLGVGLHLLTRPYESLFMVLGAGLFLVLCRCPLKPLIVAVLAVLPAIGITLLQNKRVTGDWSQLPYSLSQYQYGVPAALTFQAKPVPHFPLTPQQELDYRMQLGFHPGAERAGDYLTRLGFRIRYYRFYFYPALYLALIAFLTGIRRWRWLWVAGTCLLFALGTNFFPAFQYHYEAGVVCLFLLMSVEGLRRISMLPHGVEAARVLFLLCIVQFVFAIPNSMNQGPERRAAIARQLASTPGKLLVFVRYWPQHLFQDEWVYNGADIDGQRVVWARDLGEPEDRKLIRYYADRKVLLLEPDALPPHLAAYAPEPETPKETTQERTTQTPPSKHPLLELEQVR